MLEDKEFFNKHITPEVATITEEVKTMINKRIPVPTIYDYILKKSSDYETRYMCLFLFGLSYKWFKEDNNL